MAKPSKKKKVAKKHLVEGLVSIYATFNNTIVTIANRQGNTVSWASAGNVGFKGSRKNTPFAAQVAAEKAGRAAQEMGLEAVDVKVKGPGSGRDSAVRGLNNLGIRVMSITDITPIAHNGCRPAKKRRS